MNRRRLVMHFLAGAVLAGDPLVAAPAAASVRYDPRAKSGFVDGADVRTAFGWTDAVLASRAAGVAFAQEFQTLDTYAVSCGGAAFPVEHHRVFGRYELTAVVVPDGRRGAATGYHGRPIRFRLTGARSGISGTSVAPTAGQPCPRGDGASITRVALMSTASTWTLAASSGEVRHELLRGTGPG